MKILHSLKKESDWGRFVWENSAPDENTETSPENARAAAEAELHTETRERLSIVATEVQYLEFVDTQADQNFQKFTEKLDQWGTNLTGARLTSLSEHSILLGEKIGADLMWKKAQEAGKATEVYNLYRSEAVARMQQELVRRVDEGKLDAAVASQLVEKIMSRYPSKKDPAGALLAASRMVVQDFSELPLDRAQRAELTKKMSTGVSVAPKNGQIEWDGQKLNITECQILVGAGMTSVDARLLGNCQFKNVVDSKKGAAGEVLLVGQMQNGCEGNFVVIRAKTGSAEIPTNPTDCPDGDCDDRSIVGGVGTTNQEKITAVGEQKEKTDKSWKKVDQMVTDFFLGLDGKNQKAMIDGLQKAIDGRTLEGGVLGLAEAVFRDKNMKNFWKKYNITPELFSKSVQNQLASYKLGGLQPEIDVAVGTEVQKIDEQIAKMGRDEWLKMAKAQPQLGEWAKIVESEKWSQVKKNLASDIVTSVLSTVLTGQPDVVLTNVKLPFVNAVVALPGVNAVMKAHGLGSYTEVFTRAVNNEHLLDATRRNALLADQEGYDGSKPYEEYVAEKNKSLLEQVEKMEVEIDAMEARVERHSGVVRGQAKLLKKTSFGLLEGGRKKMREAIKDLKENPDDPTSLKKVAALETLVEEGVREMREDFSDVTCEWGEVGFEKEWKMPKKFTFGPDRNGVTVVAEYVQGNWHTSVQATVSGRAVDWKITPANVSNLREDVPEQAQIKRAYNRAMRKIRKIQSRSSALESVHALSRQANSMIEINERKEMMQSVMDQRGEETSFEISSGEKVHATAEKNTAGDWWITLKKGKKSVSIAADASTADVEKLPPWAERGFVEIKKEFDQHLVETGNQTPESAKQNVESGEAWAMLDQFASFSDFQKIGNGWRERLFEKAGAAQAVENYFGEVGTAETNGARLRAFDTLWGNSKFREAWQAYRNCAIILDCPKYRKIDWKVLKSKVGEDVAFTVDTVVGAKHVRMPITVSMLRAVKELVSPSETKMVPNKTTYHLELAKNGTDPKTAAQWVVDNFDGLSSGAQADMIATFNANHVSSGFTVTGIEDFRFLAENLVGTPETGYSVVVNGFVEKIVKKGATDLIKSLVTSGGSTVVNAQTGKYGKNPVKYRTAKKNAKKTVNGDTE